MNKNIFLFFIFFVLGNPVFAGEDDALYTDKIAPQIPEITSINYSGVLGDETIININGTYLDTCTSLKIGNNVVEIKDTSSSVISYAFKNNKSLEGTAFLECGKYKPNRGFAFPFIQSIEGFKKDYFDGNITIRGENFGNNGSVTVEGGAFTVNTYTDRIIIGTIPKEIKSSDISVTADSMTSNIYKIGLSIPKIDFIYTPVGFTKGNEIFLYGKNLYSDYGTFIQYGTTKINKFKHTADGLSFTLGDDVGEKEISASVNNISSNSLKINITQNSPRITAFGKGLHNTPDSSISLEVENLPLEENKITVYQNGSIIGFKPLIQNNTIIIENAVLSYGNNYFQVGVNGRKSNIVTIENKIENPAITGITIGDIDDNLRLVQLGVHNYVEGVTKIYLDGGNILAECKSSVCKIYISGSQSKGKFSIGYGDYINPEGLFFETNDENTPYIKEIKFYEFPKAFIQYEIYGSNFLKSDVNGGNMFSTTERDGQQVADFKIVSDDLITARLPYDYASGSTSTLSISKNGVYSNVSFSAENIIGNRLITAPIISDFEAKDKSYIFKQNQGVNIYGKGFATGDTLVINNTITLKLTVKNYKEASFVIPGNVTIGENSFYIKNMYGQQSEVKTFKVVDASETNNIKIITEKIDSKNLYVNESSTTIPLYTLKINNNKRGLLIEGLSFVIKGEQNSNDLGTFSLSVGGKTFKSIPEKNGILHFSETMYIEPSYEVALTLYKDSDFIKTSDIQIYLDSKSLQGKLEGKKYTPAVFSFGKVETNSFSIQEKEDVICIDSDSENVNCKNFLSQKTEKEEKKVVETSEVKNPIYTKLDISLSRIYLFYSKNTPKKQMEIYKAVKTKIDKIILKEKDQAKKEIFIYIRDNFNIEYKKAFQNYLKTKQ